MIPAREAGLFIMGVLCVAMEYPMIVLSAGETESYTVVT